MSPSEPGSRIGYVLKVYPRFSETFILNEVLAHQAAGVDLEIFSLRPPRDGRFHEDLAEVRAPVTYLADRVRRAPDLWDLLGAAAAELPGLEHHLRDLLVADVHDAAQAVELALLARERGITHLHAHFASVATTVARLASLLAGIPYTFTAHAKDIFHEQVDADDLRRKLQDASAVVTVSEFNVEHLRRAHGAASAGVQRVYNGLDLDRFPYCSPRRRPPLLAGVGRLVEKKGFADLVDACAVLARRGRRFRCEIVGAGPEEDALRRRVAAAGLDGAVRLRGPLPQGEVRALVTEAAALAAPCVVGADGNRDGLPTVLLEAMALGTPCVSTPVTGIPEVVRHDRTGLLVPEHDAEALADALERLLDDGILRERLALAARALVEEDFDVHRQAARLRRHFTGVPAPEPAVAGEVCA
jgi:colanic acid/amylovoran biosynthesis glycosyltransferase